MSALNFIASLVSELNPVRDAFTGAYCDHAAEQYPAYVNARDADDCAPASRDEYILSACKRANELYAYKLEELDGKLLNKGLNPAACSFTRFPGGVVIVEGENAVMLRLNVVFPVAGSSRPALVHDLK